MRRTATAPRSTCRRDARDDDGLKLEHVPFKGTRQRSPQCSAARSTSRSPSHRTRFARAGGKLRRSASRREARGPLPTFRRWSRAACRTTRRRRLPATAAARRTKSSPARRGDRGAMAAPDVAAPRAGRAPPTSRPARQRLSASPSGARSRSPRRVGVESGAKIDRPVSLANRNPEVLHWIRLPPETLSGDTGGVSIGSEQFHSGHGRSGSSSGMISTAAPHSRLEGEPGSPARPAVDPERASASRGQGAQPQPRRLSPAHIPGRGPRPIPGAPRRTSSASLPLPGRGCRRRAERNTEGLREAGQPARARGPSRRSTKSAGDSS